MIDGVILSEQCESSVYLFCRLMHVVSAYQIIGGCVVCNGYIGRQGSLTCFCTSGPGFFARNTSGAGSLHKLDAHINYWCR